LARSAAWTTPPTTNDTAKAKPWTAKIEFLFMMVRSLIDQVRKTTSTVKTVRSVTNRREYVESGAKLVLATAYVKACSLAGWSAEAL
jgi:hypothetical protein